MSYPEKDGLVILSMSREDYELLTKALGQARNNLWPETMWLLRLENRLNSGNPHYTPYQTGEKKS